MDRRVVIGALHLEDDLATQGVVEARGDLGVASKAWECPRPTNRARSTQVAYGAAHEGALPRLRLQEGLSAASRRSSTNANSQPLLEHNRWPGKRGQVTLAVRSASRRGCDYSSASPRSHHPRGPERRDHDEQVHGHHQQRLCDPSARDQRGDDQAVDWQGAEHVISGTTIIVRMRSRRRSIVRVAVMAGTAHAKPNSYAPPSSTSLGYCIPLRKCGQAHGLAQVVHRAVRVRRRWQRYGDRP
jgi:hypothetical protein